MDGCMDFSTNESMYDIWICVYEINNIFNDF